MKKNYILGLLFHILCYSQNVHSQICDSITPVFNVNLNGQPGGTYLSPAITRVGLCCGVTSPDKCIEFIVLLDSNSAGIKFDIAVGAVPPGALFYQIGCGPQVQVGEQICLYGPGPHLLTFCKPGNNTNVYSITSVPKASLNGTEWVSMACSGQLNAIGLMDTSIAWTSVPYDSTYNSYLDCTKGCPSVKVQPNQLPLPAYVDYQVSGYVLGGCLPVFFTDTIRVNFVNDLAVNITPQNPTICFGMPDAVVTANTSGGLAPYNYLWSNGATTQTVSLGPGTYTVQLTDSLSCSIAVDTVVVNSVPSLIAANAGPDQLYCSNMQAVNLSGVVNTATGGQWFGGSGTFIPDNTTLNATYVPSASDMAAGSVPLMLVTTGNFACPADTDNVVLTVSPSPSPSILGNSNVCAFSTDTYSSPFVAGMNYSWNVTGGTITASFNDSIVVQWGNTGTGTIALTETNASTCDSTVTINVNIRPMPAPIINGMPAACRMATLQYTLVNPDSTNSFLWTATGGTILGSANSSKVVVQWSTAGNATLRVTESNALGCESSTGFAVTVNPLPAAVLSGPPSTCEQNIETYTVPFVPGDNYFWSVTNGAIVGFTVANSIDVNWFSSGLGEVHVTQVSPTGCDSSAMMFVNVRAKPQPSISGPSAVCQNESAVYAASSDSSSTFLWSLNGGTNNGNLSPDSLAVQWNTPGSGSINLIQTTQYGCTNVYSIPVQVNQKPNPVIQGNGMACLTQSGTAFSTPAEPGMNYQWVVAGGTILSGNGTEQISVQWLSVGNNTVTLSKTNASTGCDSTISLAVRVDSLVPPSINTSGLNGCAPLRLSFSSNMLNSSYNYAWNFGDGHASSSFNPSNTFNQPGIYPIELIVANNTGCSDTVTTQVTVYNTPTSNFLLNTSSETYYAEMSHLTLTNQSWGATQYLWDFGNGDSSDLFEPAYDYSSPGIYQITLTVINQYGCMDRINAVLEVKVPEDIYVPSAFTPNGDAMNDFFDVKFQNITGLNVRIFNRWGEQIYQSNDPLFKWDGTYKGNVVQEDVYVYLIKAEGYHGKSFDLAGSVTVLK